MRAGGQVPVAVKELRWEANDETPGMKQLARELAEDCPPPPPPGGG
jgi:hypothetical protein